MIKLFVYGLIKDMFEGKSAVIKAKCYNLGAYPAITEVNTEGSWDVHGKVISVTADELTRLDSMEGYPDLYHRQLVKVRDEYVQVYVYTNPSEVEHNPPCSNFIRRSV